jgi:hypothetical protein
MMTSEETGMIMARDRHYVTWHLLRCGSRCYNNLYNARALLFNLRPFMIRSGVEWSGRVGVRWRGYITSGTYLYCLLSIFCKNPWLYKAHISELAY